MAGRVNCAYEIKNILQHVLLLCAGTPHAADSMQNVGARSEAVDNNEQFIGRIFNKDGSLKLQSVKDSPPHYRCPNCKDFIMTSGNQFYAHMQEMHLGNAAPLVCDLCDFAGKFREVDHHVSNNHDGEANIVLSSVTDEEVERFVTDFIYCPDVTNMKYAVQPPSGTSISF